MAKFNNRAPLKWRFDDDGLLRVTICALKEGVYEYGSDETPSADKPELRGLETIGEYVPESELRQESAIKSLEGKDVIIGDHEWRTPESYADGQIVGNVAGTPWVENGELLCDAIIKDPTAIQLITSSRVSPQERLVEVSAGYDGDLLLDKNVWQDKEYNAIQTNLRFNHILLLPEGKGRCGADVRIVNQKQERNMPTVLKIKIGEI